jgi:response regulator of citrate/malate metabolism
MIKTLIVEDDFRVADIHANYVDNIDGFKVVGKVHNASEAINFFKLKEVDLILLDIYLPDMTGLELYTNILKANFGKPVDVFIISAARDSKTVKDALRLGAVNYIVKPFTQQQLAERLVSYLRAVRQLSLKRDNSQADVDRVTALMRGAAPQTSHDKLDNPTVEAILSLINTAPTSLSAVDIATATGISRATAQRYLAIMTERKLVKLELQYGTAGRPINKYLRFS